MLSLIKRQAKTLKKLANLKLSKAQESIARSYQCADFHELQQIIQYHPDDDRLNGAGLCPDAYPGTADGWKKTVSTQAAFFADALNKGLNEANNLTAQIHGFDHANAIHYLTAEDLVLQSWSELDSELEDTLSGSIAETNALGYMIDDWEIIDVDHDYDAKECIVFLSVSYSGEQDPDRMWCGTTFYLKLKCRFIFEDGEWKLNDIELTDQSSDFDDTPEELFDFEESLPEYPVMTIADIENVMKKAPELTHFGFGSHRSDINSLDEYLSRIKKDKQSLLDAVDECNQALRFLVHTTPIKSFNYSFTSYGLKHEAERYLECVDGIDNPYVANGALICAAIHFGYKCKPANNRGNPNVVFNISTKSPVLKWLSVTNHHMFPPSGKAQKDMRELEDQLQIADVHRKSTVQQSLPNTEITF